MRLRSRSVIVLGTLAVALGACRSGAEPSDSARASAGPADALSAKVSVSADASAVPPTAVSAAPKPVLPALKPILKKPFPEGADEATVCEAIDSNEQDLWLRFGHIVPAYITGALFILETGPENKDKLYNYIANDYATPFGSWQASCRGNLTLLYIRLMYDKPDGRGKPVGLSQAIDKKFGIKTRDSFQFQPDIGRQAEYCRADAQLCEALERLDIANEGKGLCSGALHFLGISSQDEGYAQDLAVCRTLPLTTLVCAYFDFSHLPRKESIAASDSCEDSIRAAFNAKKEATRPR